MSSPLYDPPLYDPPVTTLAVATVVTTSQPPAVEKAIDFDYMSDMASVSDLIAQQPDGIEAITWSA